MIWAFGATSSAVVSEPLLENDSPFFGGSIEEAEQDVTRWSLGEQFDVGARILPITGPMSPADFPISPGQVAEFVLVRGERQIHGVPVRSGVLDHPFGPLSRFAGEDLSGLVTNL
jgi:hypothetical protein